MKINGVDNLVVDRIKQRTQKKVVIESEKTKITEDKHKEDQKEKKQKRKQKDSELEKNVQKINKLLQDNNKPIYFKITYVFEKTKVEIINKEKNKTMFVINPEKVYEILERLKKREGFIIDETI